MNLRTWRIVLLTAVLAGCASPAPTATAVPPSPTAPPPTASLVPPSPTSAPTSTMEPSATPPPTATAVPPTPTITATPGPAMPAGMGELLVTNNVGQYDISFAVDAKTYTIPMGGGKLTVYLAPGNHHFAAARNQAWSFDCSKANNCTVEIVAGQITQLSIDRSNYGN
jgi:hypothetical protein